MLTSDISANSPLGCNRRRSPAGANHGFTLLELIVVLVLMSSITALALPNLSNLYGTLGRNTERDKILDELSALGQKAWSSQTNLMVHGSKEPAMDGDSNPTLRTDFNRTQDSMPQEDQPDYDSFVQEKIELPAGWKLELERPLRALINGVCLGADVTLIHHSGYIYRTTLEPPYCHEQARPVAINRPDPLM
jgi:prepilin-type N-terminal cleavage/methylation domain-containing protein